MHVDTEASGVDVGARHTPSVASNPAHAQRMPNDANYASQGGAEDRDTFGYSPAAEAPQACLDVPEEEPKEGQPRDKGACPAAPRDPRAPDARSPIPSSQLS